MKIDKMFHVRMSEDEVKRAILDYLIACKKIDKSYVEHILENVWCLDTVDGEFVLVVDGSVECNPKGPL